MDPAPFASLHPRVDAARRLLVLELDHGKANEMGVGQLDAFEALCGALERDDEIRCLCTSSARHSAKGRPIFIAGANVTERGDWDTERVKAHVVRQRELMRRLAHLPLFTIAVSHGATLGWGVEFLLTADYVLVTPGAALGLPETGLGILPGARGTAELAGRIGPAQAMRLGCTGETIDATEAVRIGLAQELVRDLAAAMARVEELAQLLARRSPTAVAAFKRGVLAAFGRDEAARLELERQAYEACVDSGDAALGRERFATILAGDAPAWARRRA